jgi:hypothetical protein
MAARNSCTHITWAEAKSRVGGSGGPKGAGGKGKPKGVSHTQVLAQKIIAKQAPASEKLVGKKSLRKQTREDEKAAATLAAAKEERERERRNRTVRPYDLGLERQKELAKTLQSKWKDTNNTTTSINADVEEMKQIAECKGMQLDELMALEAIFADADEYGVCEATRLEDLRQTHESFLEDEDNETVLKSLVGHPEASFTIQFTVPNEMGILNNADDMELSASVVLHVTLPPTYPNTAPTIQIHDCMVTDKNAVCSPDKPLETLAFLDETKLQAALAEEVKGILPYPCVYEVGVTWLTENIYNYLELRVHAVLVNSTE